MKFLIAYLLVFIGLRISFEFLTAVHIIKFGLFNPLWYLSSIFVILYAWFFSEKLNRFSEVMVIPLIFLCLFIFNSTAVILFSFLHYGEMPEGSASMYAGFVASFVSYIAVGLVLGVISDLKSAGYILTALFFILVLPILVVVDYSSLSIPFRQLFEETGVNYLLFGDLISLVFFVILGSRFFKFDSIFAVSISFVFCSLLLYANGSRTSFLVFIVCFLLCYLVVMGVTLRGLLFVSIGFLLSITLISFVFISGVDFEKFESSRMLSILSSGSNDGSLVNRELINQGGLIRIDQYPLEGDIGGQVAHPYGGAPLGSYMHNFISFWEQFGFLSFLSYVLSWLSLGWLLIKYFVASANKQLKFSLLALFMYSLICMIFSRAFVHTVFMAAWAYIFIQLNYWFSRNKF